MIFAAIITIYGLVFLIRGKGTGKDAVAHPHYRLLGGFLLTFIPVQLVLGLLIGIAIAMSNPNITDDGIKEKLTFPSIALGLGMLVTYLVIAHFWEKSIKAKAARAG